MVFDYTAEGFSEERFRECGAMVAVVMNYDKRGLVGRAVESAFAQDWPCYEILAVDDASTDGSCDEMLGSVRRCVEANPAKAVRARVVVNDVNVGVLGQWRRVVALSGGRWFGMFGADDEAMPCRMRKAAEPGRFLRMWIWLPSQSTWCGVRSCSWSRTMALA